MLTQPISRTLAILSSIIGLGLVFIGARFLLAPEIAEQGFGIAVNEHGNHAFHAIKGIRDLFCGIMICLLTWLRWRRPLGVFLLVGSLIPLVDMLVVWFTPNSNLSATLIHGSTAVTLWAISYFLLKSTGKMAVRP